MSTTVSTPRKIATTTTANATLAKGQHTPVDATSGALTMTLPTTAAVGVEVSVEKVDASSNAVTISGTFRGSASTITMTTQFEARTFLSEGSGSWRPVADHRTTAGLSQNFASLRMGRPASNRWVALGDSITAFNNSLTQAAGGWFHRLCVGSLGRIHPGGDMQGGIFATGGFTLEQIQATHLPSVLALSPKPGACVVFGGTNNTGATSGTAFNFAQSKATLEAICTSLVGAGIMPVLVLIPPRSDISLVRQNVDLWNAYVYQLSQRTGFPLLDAFTPLVDPATGGYLTGMSLDAAVHPSEAGHAAIADYNLAAGLHTQAMPNRPVPALYASFYNLITSGQGLFLTNTAGLGAGWTLAGGGTGITTSITAPVAADNLKGNWQHLIQAAAGGGNSWLQKQISTGWSIGDTIAFSARVRATGFSALNASKNTGADAGAVNYGLGLLFVGAGATPYGMYQWIRDLGDGTFSGRYVVPAGTTSVFVRVITNTGGATNLASGTDLAIGEVSARNLTTMGLLSV